MNDKKGDGKKITIQVDPGVEKGIYSNTVAVMHSDSEVLLDFGIFVPGRNVIRVGSRIIMNPKHAKLFLHALVENIRKYEEKFGEIRVEHIDPGHHMPPPIVN